MPSRRSWTVQRVAIAPVIDEVTRKAIEERGAMPQDLGDLLADLPA